VGFVKECIDLQWFLEISLNIVDHRKRGKRPCDKKGNDGSFYEKHLSLTFLSLRLDSVVLRRKV